jgi:hypothetical protein
LVGQWVAEWHIGMYMAKLGSHPVFPLGDSPGASDDG